jgi:ribonuclease E
MRMLMPSHAKKVQLWRDGGQPLFARHQVEAQLDAMLMPTVQLRSGGYLVINQAEALVAIDVNSGRSTRERNIEETALRTNLEAADEVARQLRLRDLAGLIVIDFIDMESKRHNAMVERRIKEALKNDRARIQIGHISHFGLLEMSRQRLRPSLAETSFIPCPHCGGTGHVRSTENAAIHVLRGIEDEGGKRRSAEIVVHVSTPIALYLLNHKRERLREIELRYVMKVIIAADDAQIAPQFRIEKIRVRSADEIPPVVTPDRMLIPAPVGDLEADEEPDVVDLDEEDEDTDEDTEEQRAADAADGAGGADEAERRRKRRRRRRRGGRREDQPGVLAGGDGSREPAETGSPGPAANDDSSDALVAAEAEGPVAGEPEDGGEGGEAAASDDDPRNRRRGRRGGRRRRRDGDGELSPFSVPGADQPDLPPVYAGPTPADPFGGRAFDIFDVMDQVERAAEAKPASRVPSASEIVNVTAPEAEAAFAEAPPAEPAAETEAAAVEPEIVNGGAPEPIAVSLPPAEIGAEEAGYNGAPPDAERVNGSGNTAEDDEIVNAGAPPPAPLIRPILVGSDGEPPAEKKRGWWRR